MGSVFQQGSAGADVPVPVPLSKGETLVLRFFFERRREQDARLRDWNLNISERFLVKFPDERINGFVLCAGYENEAYFLCHKISEEGVVNNFQIKAAYLRRFTLEELENDNRLFARIMYIARLEDGSASDSSSREAIARKTLAHLNSKHLSEANSEQVRLLLLR